MIQKSLDRKKVRFSPSNLHVKNMIWDYSDIIISVSGNTIMDIENKRKLKKENIARYVSGIID